MVNVMVKKQNKKLKKIVIIILLLILCTVGALFISRKVIENIVENDKTRSFGDCRRYVQLVCGYVQCVDYAEKSNMQIDEALLKDIEQSVKDMYYVLDTQDGTYTSADLYNLAQLAYIYSYYGLDCTKIKASIDKYYMEDEKMYNTMRYDGEQSKTESALGSNYMSDMLLSGVDDNFFTSCNMNEILKKWFNENVENIIATNQDTSDLYTILYDFYIHKYALDELNYEYMSENVKRYIDDTAKDIANLGTNLPDVNLIDDLIYVSDIFQYKTEEDYAALSKKEFSKINSREDFEFDIESEKGIVIFGAMLKIHYETVGSIYNDFLNANLSDMLSEHYERYVKSGLSEICKELGGSK